MHQLVFLWHCQPHKKICVDGIPIFLTYILQENLIWSAWVPSCNYLRPHEQRQLELLLRLHTILLPLLLLLFVHTDLPRSFLLFEDRFMPMLQIYVVNEKHLMKNLLIPDDIRSNDLYWLDLQKEIFFWHVFEHLSLYRQKQRKIVDCRIETNFHEQKMPFKFEKTIS